MGGGGPKSIGRDKSNVLDSEMLIDWDLIEKLKKLLNSIHKYKIFAPPRNYEAKVQSQIVDFDIKNMWS